MIGISSSACSTRASGVGEAWIVGEVGSTHGLGQVRPLTLEHQEEAVAIREFIGADGAVERVMTTDAVGVERTLRGGVLRQLVLHVEHDVGHRDVDVLALARALAVQQRVPEGGKAVHRGGVVGDGESHHRWGTVGVAGHVHQTRRGLDDPVEAGSLRPRARLSVGRDRHHDDVGIDLAERLVVQSPPLQHTIGEVLDDHVDLADQVPDHGQAFFGVPIEADTLLAAVGLDVDAAATVDDVGQLAARITTGCQLDLDDLRAHLREQPGDHRAREVLRQVEDAVARQHRLGRHCPPV